MGSVRSFKQQTMDYHNRPKRRVSAGLRWKPPKCSLFMALIAVGIAAALIEPATSEHSYPALNTPPILYVPDRNWRISETEQVDQIIARIRAEDAENDELVFGLEPHYHSNYANPQGDANSGVSSDKLPFRIDPVGGVVYLNDSLVGRAGENFFLYITVSDGQFTAKNEVFVNILGRSNNKHPNSRTPPSITSAVHNISQFLPAFDQLPGVQSIRNQQPNSRPSNSLPPGFAMNPSIFTPHRPGASVGGDGSESAIFPPPVLNYNPNQQMPIWPTNDADGSDEHDNDNETEQNTYVYQTATSTEAATMTTSRTRLTPITKKNDHNKDNASTSNRGNNATTTMPGHVHDRPNVADSQDDISTNSTAYSIKATTIPVIIAVCGLFVAAVAVLGYLFRKRLCALSKTLKKKSKEEMVKKSNQSNLSSNPSDDSRNSMVLQHWNGPMAYGNRYVPWERDQQSMQQSMATLQLSTSVANGAVPHNDASSAGLVGSISGGNVGGAVLGVGGGVNTAPGSGNNAQSKYDGWEFPRHRLKFFNILGEGAFGQVWRCEATDIDGFEGVTTVAVKTLKENAAEVEKNDLVSELQVMKSLEPHVNVVRLLGCCTDKDPLFVIIEYVNRGKLQTYLRNSRAERHYGNTHGKSNILTSGDLTSFMYQVAKGMDYLTSRGIIHRDLAARNILITDDHTCKVADFGFARDVVTSKIYERKSEGKLPIRWMATESLYDNIFSVKSDIWSFGILMWEIVTLGSTPYPGISAADVMRKVRDGHRLEKPEHCRRELYNIMYYCWSHDANERPTFSEVVQMLDKLLHTEMDYIELERFPDHNYYNILSLSGEKL